MATSAPRNVLASIVGWLIVALIVWWFFGWIIGTIRFLLRMLFVVIVLGALLTLYFKLRGDPD